MPSQTPIPTKSTGNVLAAADWNDLTPLNTSVGLFNVGTMLTGSSSGVTAPNWYVQAGYATPTFTAGVATLTFPTAFPNGVAAVLLTPLGASVDATATISTASLSTATLYVTASGSGYTGSGIGINWLVIGC